MSATSSTSTSETNERDALTHGLIELPCSLIRDRDLLVVVDLDARPAADTRADELVDLVDVRLGESSDAAAERVRLVQPV
ncbi:hypothetical protein GS432_18735 [Rhodococcus hoagii]|nr:hypothetical protein [Prescottella equi]